MKMKECIWNCRRRFTESDLMRSDVTRKMEMLRNLSAMLQKSEPVVSDQIYLNSNRDKSVAKEFDDNGIGWIFSVAPCFPLDGNKISIIHEPGVFYKTLVEKCHLAKRRITLASLYIGTGHLEETLIAAVRENLRVSAGQLKVKVLLDYTRGSRGQKNSRSMLLPLIHEFKDLCQVSLYHTPALRGPLRTIMPQRYNEVIGLQHMKVYLFDDSLLISGANLSNDYFTNRQDRYVLIEDCPALADFYDGLVSCVSEFSLQLRENNDVQLHSDWEWHPYKGQKQAFESAARNSVWSYYKSHSFHQNDTDGDTWVFPLMEMGQLGIHQDSSVTKRLFESALPGSVIHLATGYFNLTQEYIDTVIHRSPAMYNILMAHPTANGFMGARGPAGGIPAAYTWLASAFLKQLHDNDQQHRVQMSEYLKEEWTYHAKGLWYTLPGHHFPILTFIGSPNFGNRSVDRDLETQIAIVTKNPQLQQKFLEEREQLYSSGIPFSNKTLSEPDRKNVPLWVQVAVRLFRGLL